MAVALAALFVALSGTAVAAGVPALAKRALVADNAKKLGRQDLGCCSLAPRPSRRLRGGVSRCSAAGPGNTGRGPSP